MKRLLVVTTVVLGLLAGAGSAQAKPPGQEFYGMFLRPFLWCKAQEDLKKIVDTRVTKGLKESNNLLTTYEGELDNHGRKRCGFENVGIVQVVDNVLHGVFPDSKGGLLKGYFVSVGNSDIGFWIWWTEQLPGKNI